MSPPGAFETTQRRIRDAEARAELQRAGLPAPVLPFPTAPVPTPTPAPFPGPGVGAANDPVFTRGASIVGRAAGALGVGIFAIEILKQIGDELLERESREIEATREAEKRRTQRMIQERRGNRVVIIPDPPPDPLVTQPGALPETPLEIPPRPVFDPAEIAQPSQTPVEIEVPDVRPSIDPGEIQAPELPQPAPTPTRPGQRRRPLVSPVPSPLQFPFFQPLPLPQPLPFAEPVPRFQSPQPDPLTSLDARSVPFVTTVPQPAPQPQQNPDRDCKQVKRRRRKKGKCREGFFQERPGSTQFITWRERDCS